MEAKPKPVPRPKEQKSLQRPLDPRTKIFLPDQGPKINGSSLAYTSSSTTNFKIPEPRT